MHLIRRLLLLRSIYERQTPVEIASLYGLGLLAIFLLSTIVAHALGTLYPAADNQRAIVVILCVAYVYLLIRTITRSLIVRRRLRDYKSTMNGLATLKPDSNLSIAAQYDKTYTSEVIAQGHNYWIFAALFDFHRHTKYGDYLAKQVYYTVFETTLDREVPHILFDSKVARRRQFKYLYLKSQQISVQGSFDEYFDTYVPGTYHIDSLSFITPEVMEVLIEAQDFDIEIIGKRLLIYAPLLSAAEIEALTRLGQKLAAHINDNIDNYRDDRLTGNERVTQVTPFARQLLKSSFKAELSAAFCGSLIVIIIFTAATYPNRFTNNGNLLFSEPAILVYIMFVTSIVQTVKIRRENAKAQRAFYYLAQTDRGKPRSH